jgi:type II secretory pathway component GspD/PulD (secretin)
MGSYPFSLVQSAAAAATATGWQSRYKFLSDPSLVGSIGGYPSSGSTTDFAAGTKVKPGEKLHVGVIGHRQDFDVMLKFLQTLGKTKILSNPTLTVINNQEAKIHVGERRAYVTTTITAGASTTTTAENVTFVDIGIQLSVTPLINDEGYVTMKVKPEISSVVGNITTSSNNLIPIIDTSTAETTIIAKDGATIILGGLGREEKTESSEQVPFLGKIPVLGFFFRSKTQSAERTELLIMLTPIICEGDKLITAKDKENQKFGIKPTKKFDVFRQDIPPEYVPFVSSLITGEFIPKGFKPYSGDFKEEIAPQPMFKSPVSVNEKEELFIPKGYRAYK